jgi:enamine deaminase RidA (YjgF/YER057c/UK114 family)
MTAAERVIVEFCKLAAARKNHGASRMSNVEHPTPEGLLHNAGFSQVVVPAGKRTVYTAGQVAIDERGELIGGNDLAAQTEQAMRNVGLALAAAGAGYADIVKITTYVVNYKAEQRSVIGKARAPFFAGGKPPASTLVGVAALALPEWLVEVEAVAVID